MGNDRPLIVELVESVPSAEVLGAVLAASGSGEHFRSLASLWLTEGIPAGFNKCPLLYAGLRRDLGSRLSVSRKCISLVGSRRFGYSLRPREWGRATRESSDFDMLVVDDDLFRQLAREFGAWVDDYQARRIRPRTKQEEKYWPSNVGEGQRRINNGYIDLKLVPKFEASRAQSVGRALRDTTRLLRRRAKAYSLEDPLGTTKFPLSVRVYACWDAAVHRVAITLQVAARNLQVLT